MSSLSIKLRCALVVAAAAVVTGPSLASDWETWRGPNRNGVVNEKNLNLEWGTSGPPKVWAAKTGKTYSTVAVKGNRLYTMSNADGQDTVHCFDALNGKPIWSHSYKHPKRGAMADPNPTAATSTPVINAGMVYTISREGLAICFNAETGKVVWEKNLATEANAIVPQFGFSGAAYVTGDTAIFPVGKSGFAVNKKTGATLWKSDGEAGYSTAVPYAMDGKSGVVLSWGKGVVGVDVATGKEQWIHTWKTMFDVNATDPVFLPDGFFITAYGKAQKVKLEGGKTSVAYETKRLQTTFICPVLIGGYLYGNGSGRLMCMDPNTGESKWDSPGMGSGALIANGDKLLVLHEKGELAVVDANPTQFNETARAKVLEGKSWMQPTLANGFLYVRSIEGELVCLDLRKNK